MSQTINYGDLVRMLREATKCIEGEHETLSQLDSFGGDGDHGTTMLRAMQCLEKAIDEADEGVSIAELCSAIGWAIMGVDGGATGPLFGMLFTGMSDAAKGHDTLDVATLAAMFEGGLASVERQTKARVGDRTLMDALVPAVGALKKAAEEGTDLPAGLRRAAEAAEEGAASTANMEARYGRAKNVGARSVGHSDPGATSVSLIFKGLVQGAN